MMEKARRGTKRVVVEMGFVNEVYNERSKAGAFNELKTSLALPRQGIPMYVEVRARTLSQRVHPAFARTKRTK
jgi:hypothetical protein